MKTFEEIRYDNTEVLTESRLRREGITTVYGLCARTRDRKLKENLVLQRTFCDLMQVTPLRNKRLQEGLIQMCDANIALRHQLGAITAIVISGQLFNERTKLEKVLRDRQ